MAATSRKLALAVALASTSQLANAVILPEERADVLYHRYDGGGMEIDGPSVLVRKNIADNVSIAANYYVDNVSSASIDVITSAPSGYTEKRTEYSADVTVLHGKSLVNVGYTTSTENDYDADSVRLDISQDFFGDQLTLSMGYSQADDTVGHNSLDDFSESVDRRHYRAGISFIFARWGYASLNYEGINDEGYLNNPYREVRFDDPTRINETEKYPGTRNSDAFSFKSAVHLPWPGAVKFRTTYFSDSWKINAFSYELEYSHQFNNQWLIDFRYRNYNQSDAFFYGDIFDANETRRFQGRDKELSEYSNDTFGVGISYRIKLSGLFEELQLNTQYDHMFFDYDNFREATEENSARHGLGNEPEYEFNAYSLRLFMTLIY